MIISTEKFIVYLFSRRYCHCKYVLGGHVTEYAPTRCPEMCPSLKPASLLVVPRITATYLGHLRTGAISLSF